MGKKYDCALIGCWHGNNFGSLLNGYATYCFFKSLNFSTLMINRFKQQFLENDLDFIGHNIDFINKYYDKEDLSQLYRFDQLSILNNFTDAFCVGSDQAWNYYISRKENHYLPFVEQSKFKFSFATSFGNVSGGIPEGAYKRIREYLRRFNVISVRDNFSKEILIKMGISSKVLIEPVFLLPKKRYYEIANESKIKINEKYILTYFLDRNNEKEKLVNYYKEKLNIKVVNIADGSLTKRISAGIEKNINFYCDMSINDSNTEDFVNLINKAEFIVTDSFHGMCMSIILNKEFIAIKNIKRGSLRFDDLLSKFNLNNRAVSIEDINNLKSLNAFKPIDYCYVNRIIKYEIKKSYKYLKSVKFKMKIYKFKRFIKQNLFRKKEDKNLLKNNQ